MCSWRAGGSRVTALLYEKAAVSTRQRAGWGRMERLCPEKKAAARRCTARCQQRKWRVSAVHKSKSLRSMASAQPHSWARICLRGYNSKKNQQTPKQR